MIDELYIDGQQIDLIDSGINLDYKSNLLTDITKITSNNSYTISAPKTVNNMRIIGGFIYPSSNGDYPYKAHSGTLTRDGIQIITGATVYLLSVGEEIEFSLVWGVGSKFDNIKNKKLTEMPIVDGDTIVWDPRDPANDGKYLKINYGIDFPNELSPLMPHITAYDLLMRIFESNNISLTIDDASVENNLKTLAIPLLNRNDCILNSEKNKFSRYSNRESPAGFIPDGFFAAFDLLFTGSQNDTNVYGSWIYSPDLEGIVGYQPSYSQKVTFSGYVNGTMSGSPQRIVLIIYKDDPSNESKDEITRVEGIVEGTNCSFPIEGLEIDLDDSYTAGSTIRFMIAYNSNDIVNVTASIEVKAMFDQIIPSMDYYVVPNLPDMKQIDFIKGLCQMFNYFAYSDDDGIYIRSFNRLLSNKSKALDWSKKIIGSTELSFTVDGINQVNVVKYKEDDSVIGNYDSQFIVNNQALDPTGDFITLPFSACDTRNQIAYIPIYSYDNEGNIEIDDKPEARIVRIKERGGIKTGSFEGLDWASLLKSYYGQYISTVGQARVVSCSVILNCVDLKNIDMSIPVYIEELGGYFGIIEIKTKENDISEVSLIKI